MKGFLHHITEIVIDFQRFVVRRRSIFRQVKRKDLLLFYPFESMEPFLKLIREAAYDSNVLTIKITIYRLAKKARLVEGKSRPDY